MTDHASHDTSLRPVRSYHQRRGKTTPTQLRGLSEGWPKFGLELATGPLDLAELFGGRPVIVDIGFGMGESVLHTARERPDVGVLGIEVHERGIGQVLSTVADDDLANVRIVRGDAAEVLRDHLEEASLDEVHLYFPDPWPKARHYKRRLVQREWASLVASRLRPGGFLHAATDWQNYADHMGAVLDAEPQLQRRDDLVASFRDSRPTTKYERIGLARSHVVTDVVYQRTNHSLAP